MLDEFVPDEVRLFRRVPSQFLVTDKKTGGRRLSSNAFRNNSNPKTNRMSIVLEDSLQDSPESIVEGTAFLLVALRAGFVREPRHAQQIERTPTTIEPAHGDVVGNKTNSIRNSFAAAAEWVVPPEGPSQV